jgi:hypothetical protein
MRYLVFDESNEVLRKFATKHEAEYFTRNDTQLWIKVLPKPVIDTYGTALARLGLALF